MKRNKDKTDQIEAPLKKPPALDALPPISSPIFDIPIVDIRPFSDQPRTYFDPEELEGLQESIEEIGQLEPVMVRPLSAGDTHKFELIDGERRYRACLAAGKETIRGFLENVNSESEQFLKSTIANFCRSNHTPIETASALEKIIAHLSSLKENREANKTELVAKMSRICGRSTAWVMQHLSLLNLIPAVQALLADKRLPFQVCISLSGLKPEYQLTYANDIIDNNLDFKKALSFVRQQRNDKGKLASWARKRKPSDDYAILQRFLDNTERKLEGIMDLRPTLIREMFKNRSKQEFQQMINQFDVIGGDFKAIAGTFGDIQKNVMAAKS